MGIRAPVQGCHGGQTCACHIWDLPLRLQLRGGNPEGAAAQQGRKDSANRDVQQLYRGGDCFPGYCEEPVQIKHLSTCPPEPERNKTGIV